MASGFSFDVDTRLVVRGAFRKAPLEVGKALDKTMLDIGRRFEKHLIKNRLRGGTSKSKLGVRTGAMRRSLGVKVKGSGLSAIMHVGFGPPASPWVGSARRYASVHEHGATIRPKRSQYLAIPIAENLTGAGVARISSPRGLADPDFVPHIFSSGFGFLVFQDDQLMFLLVRQVKIPARLHFRDDWNLKKKGFQRDLVAAAARGLKKAAG